MTVDLLVDGKQFAMEVDTGTAISIISEAIYKSLLTKPQKCNVVLRTYTDELSERQHIPIQSFVDDMAPVRIGCNCPHGIQPTCVCVSGHLLPLLLTSLPPDVAPMSQDS